MTAAPPTRISPRKSLGQYFLVDSSILSQIVDAAGLTSQDLVLEVGPGLGALTRQLVRQAGRVVAIDLDPQLAASLPQRLGHPPNLTAVEADARTVDLVPLLGRSTPYKVVANLPYYAANPIVRRFLEVEPKPQLMVVMVQREVAQSMAAAPGAMTLLSVAVQFYAVPTLICYVPPESFRPRPKVTSAVVRLELRPRPAVEVADPDSFFALVRAGFSAPRKQLRNSLSHGLGEPAAVIGQMLESQELDGSRRPQTLTLEEWARVFNAWSELGATSPPGGTAGETQAL